jgi:transposase
MAQSRPQDVCEAGEGTVEAGSCAVYSAMNRIFSGKQKRSVLHAKVPASGKVGLEKSQRPSEIHTASFRSSGKNGKLEVEIPALLLKART